MKLNDISELMQGLSQVELTSRNSLVQRKMRKALAKVKRARTLLEQAEVTLDWAKQYAPPVEVNL